MLKNSHFSTPRTLAECQFVPGYRSAEPRDHLNAWGHVVLNGLCALLLVLGLPLVIFGVI